MDACRRNWDEFVSSFFSKKKTNFFNFSRLTSADLLMPLISHFASAFTFASVFTFSTTTSLFSLVLIFVVFLVSRVACTKGKDKLWSLMSSRGGGGVVRRIQRGEREGDCRCRSASLICASGVGTINNFYKHNELSNSILH